MVTSDLAFCLRGKDDAHKFRKQLARGTAGLDAIKNFVSRNTLRWIGQVFFVTGDHFVAEPLLDRCVTLTHPPPPGP
jgi:hypothetical protein